MRTGRTAQVSTLSRFLGVHQQITTPAVCERTAKVRDGGQKYEV